MFAQLIYPMLYIIDSDNTEVQNDDKSEEDLTSSTATEKNVKVAEEASFECELCDFVSNRKSGLAVHMSRKHQNIEQLDGNTSLSESKLDYGPYRRYDACVLEGVHEEIENYLKNENDVGDVDLALETWEEIIYDIEKCKLLDLSEKKEEIVRVLEARHKCFVATYTDIK